MAKSVMAAAMAYHGESNAKVIGEISIIMAWRMSSVWRRCRNGGSIEIRNRNGVAENLQLSRQLSGAMAWHRKQL
jgi:hypothetical protein